MTPKRRRETPPFLAFLLWHQLDTFGENFKEIDLKFINYLDFSDVTTRWFSSKVPNVWKFVNPRPPGGGGGGRIRPPPRFFFNNVRGATRSFAYLSVHQFDVFLQNFYFLLFKYADLSDPTSCQF